MKYLIALIFILTAQVQARVNCPDYKAVVCHAGSEINPHYVEICVSFSSLYGHLAEHEMDYYGECRLRNVKAAYACNAGMRHKDANETICIQRDNDETRYVASCGESKNCMCSGFVNQFVFDYFNVEMSTYNPFLDLSALSEVKNIQAGQDRFMAATNTPATTKIKSEGGLSFYLGSERMNGEYFVDMCWTNTTGSQQYDLDFSLSSSIISNIDNGQTYPEVTDLKSKYHLFCDYDFDGYFNYDSLVRVESSPEVPFQLGTYANYDFSISNAEFCVVRQTFEERQPERMRPWDLKKITVLNNLNIETPIPNDGPIRICHVQEITNGGGPGGNNGTNHSYGPHIAAVTVGQPFQTVNKKKIHECTQLEFRDSDHLKEYIKHGKDNKEFRDIHQHDYVGNCYSTCGPIHGNGAN
ncbi:hypothetical protein [Bacteriovorax sp. DB6_IX]|uniref:hypothetical protein n=1 Tax=Bacteriovorax sp. DB6_IX TaxID=1353530 RepID=UPI00038A2462|nr:hypothetical protein [Bacteriovorax sp. DB6_IX]EQC50503.1 hypothetical protein M901_1884 [Bacteriovorax sp. DB6_IX]